MQQVREFEIRLMRQADVAGVFEVQRQVYVPAMVEAAGLIASRLATAPDTGWVAEDLQGIAGYLACYPSVHGKISALGADFAPAAEPDALYLHDLAVAARLAGRGVAAALQAAAEQWAVAQGLRYACLVSVQNTLGFWQRHGFAALESPDPGQQAVLASYSGPAYYCSKILRG